MRYFSLILLLAFSKPTLATINLPVLATKQAVENIRYISKDGKYTYYSSQSGVLQFSTNYSFSVVHKAKKNTHYLMSASETQNKILFEKILSPHSKISFKEANEIFLGSMGKKDFKPIANGKLAKLHLGDSYLSYYQPAKKTIYLQNLNTKSSAKEIKLFNNTNAYFSPNVEMISLSDILYTDINSEGHEALLLHTTTQKEITTVYKSRFPGSKLEFCKVGDSLYVGEFPRVDLKLSSQIVRMDLYNNKNFKKSEQLYSSPYPDLGNMICSESKITFLKTYSVQEKLNFRTTDVASISLKDSSLKRLTTNTNFTQIMSLSNSIVSPYGGKLYIIDGDTSLKDDSITQDVKK